MTDDDRIELTAKVCAEIGYRFSQLISIGIDEDSGIMIAFIGDRKVTAFGLGADEVGAVMVNLLASCATDSLAGGKSLTAVGDLAREKIESTPDDSPLRVLLALVDGGGLHND